MSKHKMSKVPITPEIAEPPSFEDVLDELGMPGRFQITQLAPILLSKAITAFAALGFIFQVYTPPHQCNPVNNTELLLMYNLQNDSSASITYGSCDITLSSNQTGQMKDVTKLDCPDGRTFFDAQHTTWISEWDLVCESKGRAEFSYTLFTAGQIVGGLVASQVSDRLGRKPTFLICCFGACLMETAIIFAPTIYVIMGIRFASGFFNRNIASGGFVYAIEFLVPRHRQTYGVVTNCVWLFFAICVVTVAYVFKDFNWKYFQSSLSILAACVSVLGIFFLSESPRWLAANDKIDKALLVLRKASLQNGKDFQMIKEQFMAYIDHSFAYRSSEVSVPLGTKSINGKSDDAVPASVTTDKFPLLSLFKHRLMCKTTMITLYIWVTVVLTFYGLYMTASKLAGDRFLNVALMASVEAPSSLLAFVMLKKLGRRTCIAVMLGLTGASLLTSTLLFSFGQHLNGSAIASTALFVFGKMTISCAFCVVYIITPELFPTNLRSTASGFCNSGSRVGSMVVPYLTLLFEIVSWGPSLIFTVMSILAVILVMFLPETKHANLPNSVEEMTKQREKRQLKEDISE